ncbi:MAG: type II secretion system F family protein [Anaerolineae bacterium]|nr:type II secretion system F family protein [Anaerolineae bacterium]
MSPTIIIAIVAGLFAVGILGVGVVTMRRGGETEVEERLGRYTTEFSYDYGDIETDESEYAKDEPSELTNRVNDLLADRDFAQKWKIALARADLKLTPAEYLAMRVIGVIGMFAISPIILADSPALWPVAAVLGWFIPSFYVSRRQNKRLRAFEDQLADVLGLWVNALRSGYSVMQAMEAIAKEAPYPCDVEFMRVVQEVQLGIPMEDALDHMLGRIDSEDFDLVVTAVNIQREVGGNLAEILEVIAGVIRERIKLKGEIRVLTTQGRYTGYLIGGLPILLSVFLYAMNPEYMGRMFENRACGWPMIGCGLALIGSGAAAISKIVNIDI